MEVIFPVLFIVFALVSILVSLYFSRKENEVFAESGLKTIASFFWGSRYIEFRGRKVHVDLPDREGWQKFEHGYHISLETDVENLMSISTVGHFILPENWGAIYPYFDYMIEDRTYAVAVKNRCVFERMMTSLKIKNAINALFKKHDGQLLMGFLTVSEVTHITLKGLNKKQEVHFSSVPRDDFKARPACMIDYLANLFDLIDEVESFNKKYPG